MHIKYKPINILEVSIFNSKVDTFIMEKEKLYFFTDDLISALTKSNALV